MKNPLILLIVLVFSVVVPALGQEDFYGREWTKVYKYELADRPQSALEVVSGIFKKAKTDRNTAQSIKALIYQSKFALVLEEDAQLKVIDLFQSEIDSTQEPTSSLLESLLADIYWQHFKRYRWRYYQRTQTEAKQGEDFRTWDLQTLFQEVHHHFQQSLVHKELLQGIAIDTIDPILTKSGETGLYHPSLYDFVAHRALDFYRSDETGLSRPAIRFELDDPKYFQDLRGVEVPTPSDSLSLQYHALRIYQDLLKFHGSSNVASAYIYNRLDQLKFMLENSTLPDVRSLYRGELDAMLQDFSGIEASTLISLDLANHHYTHGDKRTARLICQQAIEKFPDSWGASECRGLSEAITAVQLRLEGMPFVPSGSYSRIRVEYANLSSIDFRVYRISRSQMDKFEGLTRDTSRWNFIKGLQAFRSWQNTLMDKGDFEQHSTEAVVPELAKGTYLLVATTPTANEVYGYLPIQVTDLSLIQSQIQGKYSYQVINRVNGAPVPSASIHLTNKDNHRGRRIDVTLPTDDLGFAFLELKDNRYSSVTATVSTSVDTACFRHLWISSYSSRTRQERQLSRAFLFTDRGIYRPGQAVYFKGILVKSIGGKSEIITGQKVVVRFNNANGEEVNALSLTSNDYGSFSGEFKLPTSGLNGLYTMEVQMEGTDFEYSSTRISVEEYKRPTFEVQFEPIETTFRLGDSVFVHGEARAFSSAVVADAKVVYRVHRKVRWPGWYYWSRMPTRSAPQEIAHGETLTGVDGSFSIPFQAIPDQSVAKEDQPVFEYQITADVTDINGETRSTTTTVKVGYHAQMVAIQVPDHVEGLKEIVLGLTAQNLNGQEVPGSGQVFIYKRRSPKVPQVSRAWAAPDLPILSEEEFNRKFPHEPYLDTHEEGQKGDLVWKGKFDTKNGKEVIVNTSKSWLPGLYIVETQSQDRFGQTVNARAKFEYDSKDDTSVPDNQAFFWNTNKDTYQPGENLKLTLGSAFKDLNVTVFVEKGGKISTVKVLHLSDQTKTIAIPVTSQDLNGFAIHYSYAVHNRPETGRKSIWVKEVKQPLRIETVTFRDRLQPGAEETWAFRVKSGQQGQEAELLASMYDASLDQFKPFKWAFQPFESTPYYPLLDIGDHFGFGGRPFSIQNLSSFYYSYRRLNLEKMNWHGFNMINPKLGQHRYLRKMKASATATVSFHEDPSVSKGYMGGVVFDKSTNEPLPGVQVLVKGTDEGVLTDIDGKFTIAVKHGDELIFSFAGFAPVSIQAKNQYAVQVNMVADLEHLEEVVVVGYAADSRRDIAGSVMATSDVEVTEEIILDESASEKLSPAPSSLAAGRASGVQIRGLASLENNPRAIYVVDGQIVEDSQLPETNEIATMTMLKGAEAKALYGSRAANGAIVITSKKYQEELDRQLLNVQARKHFKETAFFFPHLTADKEGNIQFSFTSPEALTRWKLQLLAHTKGMESATETLQVATQKDLMVVPNAPRFLRQGDEVHFSAKVSNLTGESMQGSVGLYLFDVLTGNPVDELFNHLSPGRQFAVEGKSSTSVSWRLQVPAGVSALQYKVVAQAGDVSDGEQNAVPVLPNRTLVTESLPMTVRSGQSKTFVMNKLKNVVSPTLQHHSLTLEVTSNPAWYAVQALPYLVEYPYECSEQTFARYYANSIGNHIVNNNPKLKEVFDQWRSADALLSNLEKNETLKSIIIQETPWLRDAQSETEQKKRIAELFELSQMQEGLKQSLKKLEKMQFPDGGFPWFKGSHNPNRYITQHIVAGFGHLVRLGIGHDASTNRLIDRAIKYLDDELARDYDRLLDQAANSKQKDFLKRKNISPIHIHALYSRSFYPDKEMRPRVKEAKRYYEGQLAAYWTEFSLHSKGLAAVVSHRDGRGTLAKSILLSLQENSIRSEEMGMYWKANKPGWWWHESPIETQALLIEAFNELLPASDMKAQTLDELKIWLLKNKQTNRWETTKATTEAVYALLLRGTDWLSIDESVKVKIGNQVLEAPQTVEAGTGYYKETWKEAEVTATMAEVTLSKGKEGIAWAALYWQYFEDLDKISKAETPLKLSKKLFLVKNTNSGEVLKVLDDHTLLELGDLVRVRIELRSDRDMEFVHMKDMRSSGFEPVNVLSHYKWQDGLGYYESTKDASTNFFFDYLRKGVYVFEYDLRVNMKGDFSNGITTIQSMYAPEFRSHSEGMRVEVK